MSEEKPKEKKEYTKPEIQEKSTSMEDKISLDGFDAAL